MKKKSCSINLHQRALAALFATLCLWASCSIATAQTVDSEVDNIAPVIELEEFSMGVADISQVFTVQILEETELSEATLYYRRSGQESYTSAPMSALGVSGFYTVSVTTDPADVRDIEYYVEAKDANGNRTVSGFAFDPYLRKLAPASVALNAQTDVEGEASASENPQFQTREPFYKNRWVQVAVGVVAVGIIASSMDSDGEDTSEVRVNFTLE